METLCQICCETDIQLTCDGCHLACCAECLKDWTCEQIHQSYNSFAHVKCQHQGCDQVLTLKQL
jgi:hypothetical protein